MTDLQFIAIIAHMWAIIILLSAILTKPNRK